VNLSDLIAAIADLDPADAPAVLAAVAAKLAQACSQPAPPEPAIGADDPLLTVPQAAVLLSYRPSFVYEMVRRGDLAAVKDRKFVRIRQSAMNEYIAHHEQRGLLPLPVSNMLTSAHDRKFAEAQAQGVGTNPTRTRRKDRRPQDNDREVGRRDGSDS
jgi:excisionase family DNA binding protein